MFDELTLLNIVARLSAPIAIVPEAGDVLVNPQLRALIGLKEAERIELVDGLDSKLRCWASSEPQTREILPAWNRPPVIVAVKASPFSWDGVPAVMLELTDQTAMADVEAKLDAAELRNALIARSAAVGLWDHDRMGGHFYLSPKALEILGLPFTAVVNPNAVFEELIDEADRSYVRAVSAAAFKERALFEAAFRVRLPDGSLRPVFARGLSHHDLDGKVTRFAGTLEVDHQLQTDAGGQSGQASKNDDFHADHHADLLALAQTSSRPFLDVAEDLLEISSLEAGGSLAPMVTYNVFETFNSLTDEASLAEAGNLSHMMDPRADAMFLGHSGTWRRVVTQLIRYGLMRSNGAQVEVTLTVGETGHGLLLEVHDGGPHLAKGDFKTLFELPEIGEGSQTHLDPGICIGFHLCRLLARSMGGELAASNHAGGGLVTRLYVPFERAIAMETTADQDLSLNTGAEDRSEGTFRVLVAEDNPANQRVISIILEQLGCHVTLAENGHVCVDLFNQGSFDLIFMDLHMPVMDGYAATRAIRASGPAGRSALIVALTADARAEAKAEAEAAGVDDFLTKPVVLSEIAEVLAWAIDVSEETSLVEAGVFSRSA
jgi:CheY-like chemotaxis protein